MTPGQCMSPVAGADTRFYESLWLRVNYEYQFWPDFFNHHTLNPHGWDFGVAYDFGASGDRFGLIS